MVPNGWEVKKLDLIYRVIDSLHQTPSFSEDGFYPMIRVTDIKGKSLSLSSAVMVSEQVFLEYTKKYKPKQNDIVFSRVGSYGISAFVDTDQEFCLGQNTVIAESNDNANPIYIFNILKSEGVSKQIEKAVDGSSHKTVSLKVIKNLEILLPPKKEQQKIAQILSTWDKAIAVTEKLLANSQQQKKALMQQLLTGKKRLLDGNGVRFEGEWVQVKLNDISIIIMGSSPKSEAYNEIQVGMPLIQGNADIKNRYSCPRIYTSEITKSCLQGDILLSVRAPVGNVALSRHVACMGRGIAAIRANEKSFQDFLYQLLMWHEPKWVNFSQGSTFEAINSDDIRGLILKVPNVKEQQKIANVLSTADQEIEALQRKLDCLQQEKKALMQQLLTGKRRVKVAA